MKLNSQIQSFTRIFPKKIIKNASRSKTIIETGFFDHEPELHICHITQLFLRDKDEDLFLGERIVKKFKNKVLIERGMGLLISTLDEYFNHLYQFNQKSKPNE